MRIEDGQPGAVKLAGRLPKNETLNGMDAIAAAAVADPDDYMVVVVAQLGVAKVNRDTATPDRDPVLTPTLAVLRIEPLRGPQASAALGMLNDAKRRRTGISAQPELPLGDHDDDQADEDDPLAPGNIVDTVTDIAADAIAAAIDRGETPPPAGEVTAEDIQLLRHAAEVVINAQFGSVSMVQRKLRVGHTTALRLMELLEQHGVVSAPAGAAKARDVLTRPEQLAAVLTAIDAAAPQP